MKMARRITAMALAVLMLVSIAVPDVYAAQLHNPQFETRYINPLYDDILTESELTPPSHHSTSAADSEEDTYYTTYGAGLQMRPDLVDRQEIIAVNVYLEEFNGTQAAFDQLCLDVVSSAMLHTGVPTEGDYLLWQFGGYSAEAQYMQTEDGLYLFHITFTFTYYTDAAQEAELDAAVAKLLTELDVDDADSYTKLKAIYDYICDNVAYDHANVDNKNYKLQYTAYAALIDGIAVCQGYSLLLYRLALELGVDCRLISGDGGGPHAWNIAELDGLYYNMDSTWDAGESSYSYFLRSPANFSGHTRDAEYDTASFHSAYPMAENDYIYCDHVFENRVTAAPSCTAAGIMTYTCSLCGYSYTDAIPATGHSYDEGVVCAPTCTEQGYTTYTCMSCGESYIDNYTDALGHNFGDWYTTQEPTCTADGIRQHDCLTCGASETEAVPALEHTYTSVVTEPTCTEQGYTTYTCVCGDSYIDNYTNALGHSFGDWYTTQEPTCTSDGIRQHDCLTCSVSETETVPALEHTYTAVVTEPTCTEQGYTTYTCACGASYVDSYTEALGHTWDEGVVVTEPTEEADGIRRYTCLTCGATEDHAIPALGHTHAYESIVTEPTCTEQGYTTHTCACGDSYIDSYTDALGHEWRGTVCTRCGATRKNPFTDVPEDSFYFEPVLWAVENGITTGATDTTFDPNGNCLRGHVVTFLWRAAGEPEPTTTKNPFTDVKETDFFYKAVLWAVENGITNGTAADTFSPYQACNRAQVVTFLWRAAGKPQPASTENPFTDVVVTDFYGTAVLWAVENGITNGMGDGTFGVLKTCNRAQVVTFLYRAYIK